MQVYSCKGCVAPKRYPGCHSKCHEYIAQRAEYDRLKAAWDQQQAITIGIYTSRNEKVYKAMKDRRNKKV